MNKEIKRPEIDRDDKLYPSHDDNRLDQLGNIKGKTLEVYYYLVDHPGQHGVRKIQRELEYNSSSVAAYHLNRLYEHDLVDKTEQGKEQFHNARAWCTRRSYPCRWCSDPTDPSLRSTGNRVYYIWYPPLY